MDKSLLILGSIVIGLWSFVGDFWSFADGLWSFVGSLWSFVGGLWSFVCSFWLFVDGLGSFLVVACFSNYASNKTLVVCDFDYTLFL